MTKSLDVAAQSASEPARSAVKSGTAKVKAVKER